MHKGLQRKKLWSTANSKMINNIRTRRPSGMAERLRQTAKTRLSIMKIDNSNNSNKPYKLDSDVAELIKTLGITPNATTKIWPFGANFGRKPKTPLNNAGTIPKSSNLSWENTKFTCLDQKLSAKPALPAETMWYREKISEDELDLFYRQPQKLPELTFNPPADAQLVKTPVTLDDKEIPQSSDPDKNRNLTENPPQPTDAGDWDITDDKFDRQLKLKFPICAQLPLTNNQFDMKNVQRAFRNEITKHYLSLLRTKKPIKKNHKPRKAKKWKVTNCVPKQSL